MSIQDLEHGSIPLIVHGDVDKWALEFWHHQKTTAERAPLETVADTKKHDIPLARIRKIMKCEEVGVGPSAFKSSPRLISCKMISGETPVLLSFACQIFTAELSARAYAEALSTRRRTVQRSDVVRATTKDEMYDFLIDLLPREEMTQLLKRSGHKNANKP